MAVIGTLLFLSIYTQLVAPILTESTTLSSMEENKRLTTQTQAPSLCVVNHTLVQLSIRNDNKNLVYDVFGIEPDGSINLISLENELLIKAEGADVAFHNASNTIIQVHSDIDHNLYYRLGQLKGGLIEWKMLNAILYAEGGDSPSVAVTESDIVVSVHIEYETNMLLYNLGRLDQNASKIEWAAPVVYNKWHNTWPAIYIVGNNTVVEAHIGGNHLFYTIGTLSAGADLDTMTINWLMTQRIPNITCSTYCHSIDVMIDPFGVVMVSYSELWRYPKNQDTSLKYIYRLRYLTGVLTNLTIDWSDSGAVIYYHDYNVFFENENSRSVKPSITFLQDYNHIYVESHDSHHYDYYSSYLVMNTLSFGVELVNIEYKPYLKLDSNAFAIHETHFNNNGPVNLTQTWILEEQFSCTNTYHWESNFHLGVSVTDSVHFLGSGVSTTAFMSIDLSVGQSSSISGTFTWTETNSIMVPGNAGNVSYSATIYRDTHSIPFVATFKRGTTTWTETGTVEVSHGAIYSRIVSNTDK